MRKNTLVFQLLFFLLMGNSFASAKVDPQVLARETKARLSRVIEFAFIKEEAEKLGLKVYLFGGTASAFAHYVRWDLEREAGDDKYQEEKFDYEFTNIYRGNQDLDIVVDGTMSQLEKFRIILKAKFPHFVGEKEAWEVRSLRKAVKDKHPLLGDYNFLNQHTDTNSTGMIALHATKSEPIYRDLFMWDKSPARFLEDVAAARIQFLFAEKHSTTKRFKEGKNPPILAAVRYLAKLTQYEIKGDPEDLSLIKKIIVEAEWKNFSDYVINKLEEFGLKILLNSPDSEYAWNLLEETGLRKKLIQLNKKGINTVHSLAWWMSKEPLRSKLIGQGDGKTARELFEVNQNGDIVVSHETNSFYAYENIVRSSKGQANVFISREKVSGEAAVYGDGFYTSLGREGARGTGLTVRFILHPQAREGVDFFIGGGHIIVTNKAVLRLIPENLNISYLDFMNLAINGDLTQYDLGLQQKLQRKFSRYAMDKTEEEAVHRLMMSIEWTSENFYVFDLWYGLIPSKNQPEILKRFVEAGGWSNHFFLYRVFESSFVPELKKVIVNEFIDLDFDGIREKFSGRNEIYEKILHVLMILRSYKHFQNQPELIKKLDKEMAFKLTDLAAAIRWNTKGYKQEERLKLYKEAASILVHEIQKTDSLEDDSPLIIEALRMSRSYWEKFKYYVWPLLGINIPPAVMLSVFLSYQYFGVVLNGENVGGYVFPGVLTAFSVVFFRDAVGATRSRLRLMKHLKKEILSYQSQKMTGKFNCSVLLK